MVSEDKVPKTGVCTLKLRTESITPLLNSKDSHDVKDWFFQ